LPDTTNTTSTSPHAESESVTDPMIPSSQTTMAKVRKNASMNGPDSNQAPEPALFNPTGRWWGSVCFGILFSIPFGWLLSYAAALPFFIGMFFFVLFGLIIGAAVFRVASKNAPYPSTPLVVGTTLIVLLIWSFTIVKESRDFPLEAAKHIADQTRDIGDQSIEEFRADVVVQVKQFLRTQYAPGGTIGYVRWVLTDGLLQANDFDAVQRTVSAPQIRLWWAVRVTLSIALLAFGIGSQTLTLKNPIKPTKKLAL